jgi:hypothetical protein
MSPRCAAHGTLTTPAAGPAFADTGASASLTAPTAQVPASEVRSCRPPHDHLGCERTEEGRASRPEHPAHPRPAFSRRAASSLHRLDRDVAPVGHRGQVGARCSARWIAGDSSTDARSREDRARMAEHCTIQAQTGHCRRSCPARPPPCPLITGESIRRSGRPRQPRSTADRPETGGVGPRWVVPPSDCTPAASGRRT